MKDKDARKEINELEERINHLQKMVKTLIRKEGYSIHLLSMPMYRWAIYETHETMERNRLPKKFDALVDALGYKFEQVEVQPSKMIAIKKKPEDKND